MSAYFLAGFAVVFFLIASTDAVVMPERLSDRLISSQRVDKAIEFCEILFRDLFRTKQVPTGAFQVCIMAYIKKMARELDDVELIYPKSFT
ncbi:unnamed protein product [Rodentolepis nana]|uniref:Odorant binding protein n=1 Tax=Rodentolepis nana TaxID=102285 RepID=A0A0R3T8C7_RODNA|nr:unnamed protein product [Rodentolepis nana]